MNNDIENASEMDESVPRIVTDRVEKMSCSECGDEIDLTGVEPFSKVECPECLNLETAPARLGHFLLLNLIGSGGMGGVYHAKDESLGRFVAIKVMLESLGKNRKFVETFKREAQAVAKLNHPNIAQVYSFGMEKGQPYIVMEFVGGERFDRIIASGEELDQGLVMKIGLDIAEALSAANEIGLVHGDIKPENILLDEKWKAKLVDFGLARFAGQAAEEGVWGTPYYIAPERALRQSVDSRADMYSLGATLYHALTGKPPFDGETPVEVVKARLNSDPWPVHLRRKDVNDEVENIVMRMLQALPARRYPNYNSLLSDMRNAIKELGADSRNYASLAAKKTVRLFVPKAAKADKRRTDAPATGDDEATDDGGELRARVETSPFEEHRRKQLAALQEQRESRARRTRIILWMILVGALVAAGAGVANSLKQRNIREAQARQAFLDLQAQVKQVNETYGRLIAPVTNILAMETTASAYIEKVTNAVTGAQAAAAAEPQIPANADADAMRMAAAKVKAETDKVFDKAQKARTAATNGLAFKNKGTSAASANVAREAVAQLSACLASATQAEAEAGRSLASAEQALGEIMALKKKIEKDRKEALAREALRALQERRQREEEERKTQVQSEIEMAQQAKNGAEVFLAEHKYREAASDLDVQLASYRTDEGKSAVKLLIEKYRRLQSLKSFVIERLAAEGYPWGYPKGASYVDVLGADEKEVKIRGGSAPWTSIAVPQMKKFIDRALSSSTEDKVPAKALAEYYLAAAIFCELNGRTNDVAAYAAGAVERDSNLKPDSARLLPAQSAP